jgi:hypothetical protein
MKWDGISEKMAAVDPDIHIEVDWVVYPISGGHEAVFAYDRSSAARSRKVHSWRADKFASVDEAVSQVKAFMHFLRQVKKNSAAQEVSAPAGESTSERSKVWF